MAYSSYQISEGFGVVDKNETIDSLISMMRLRMICNCATDKTSTILFILKI